MVGKNNDDFDIDAYGCSNRTPLHYAAFEGIQFSSKIVNTI